MPRCIALLRGVNVGTARRIAMADLREIIEKLGHAEVRTLLNSGNAVFDAPRSNLKGIAAEIELAIEKHSSFKPAVTVLSAAQLAEVVADNPLLSKVTDPSRHLIAFSQDPKNFSALKPMEAESWTPDALSFGRRVAYLWCVKGVLDSPLSQAFSRRAGAMVTVRNWSTVLKLHQLTPA